MELCGTMLFSGCLASMKLRVSVSAVGAAVTLKAAAKTMMREYRRISMIVIGSECGDRRARLWSRRSSNERWEGFLYRYFHLVYPPVVAVNIFSQNASWTDHSSSGCTRVSYSVSE